jgi:O-antigen ligase
LVDPGADAAFDAPKRLAMLLGAGVAGMVLAWRAQVPDWRAWSTEARWAALAGIALLASLALATLASQHPDLSRTALRHALLAALLVPLGASPLLAGVHGRRLFIVAGAAVLANALISLAQLAGWSLPLAIENIGGRLASGALLGNEGYVALACALLASACLAPALFGAAAPTRRGAGLVIAIALAAILANRQATALAALLLAAGVLVALRWRQRWLLWGGTGILALALLAALVPPLRTMTWGALPAGGVPGYQALTTYRLGAWVAAEQMVRDRPLAGHGPGTYSAFATGARMAAEIRLGERFVQPLGTSFAHAHNDYLELAAEAGLPALLAALAGLAAVLYGLAARLLRRPDPEAAALMAVLVAGAVAALAWFPLHIPLLAMLLLLALGRAWRRVAARPEAGP